MTAVRGAEVADAMTRGEFDGVPACTGAGVSDAPAHGQPSRCESGGVPSLAFVLAGLGAAVAAVRHR
jgi:phage tail tape-measure protein